MPERKSAAHRGEGQCTRENIRMPAGVYGYVSLHRVSPNCTHTLNNCKAVLIKIRFIFKIKLLAVTVFIHFWGHPVFVE